MAQNLKSWLAAGLVLALAANGTPAQACVLTPAEKIDVIDASLLAPKHSALKRAAVKAMRNRAVRLIAANKLRAADRLANRALISLGITPPRPAGPASTC